MSGINCLRADGLGAANSGERAAARDGARLGGGGGVACDGDGADTDVWCAERRRWG